MKGYNGNDNATDIIVSIIRLDGLTLWEEKLSSVYIGEPLIGEFTICLNIPYMFFGVNLYKLSVDILHDNNRYSGKSIVFEVCDIDGQVGGHPMLYYPPRMRLLSYSD